ncbi:SDR family oxidoreductase [Bifidobacterium sp. ESL0690]|uniref:SDR family oxidoreductase n=1 Tax=Bifidobacterium sp. ESL0690 TaxID=2983214 RepID=UPI0023F8883C|nr:SDR family oxidoreductase [Bifidobacterium sp. ESL0690]WEV47384.1 SDR family oxidoreductase [Bifidobacterium sp. ESL0690]
MSQIQQQRKVIVLGGHGKVALLAEPKLKEAGFSVDAVIRNPAQSDDVRKAGANPVVFDMEHANVDSFAGLFVGAVAVVFSAGAGGGDDVRTHAVDYQAAVNAMDAAEKAGVRRFVMVSYDTADRDPQEMGWPDSFITYAQSKHDADAHLRDSSLEYTILGPGLLTLEPETDKIVLTDDHTMIDDKPATNEQRKTSRGNVAAVIARVLSADVAKRKTIDFYDGDKPIDEVLV